MSRLPHRIQQLEAPYLATRYRVYLPTATEDVRVGEPAPAVDAWLAEHEAQTAAIVTACNPGSRLLGQAANRRLQAALLHLLHSMPHPMLPGCNIAEDGGWPEEHSLIIAGLSRGEARRLAARFGQHALIWLVRDAPARLAWVRD